MIFNDTILVLFPLVPMLFLLIIMVLYHKSHSKYLSENVLFLCVRTACRKDYHQNKCSLKPFKFIRTSKEDQRRYWTNRILREKGVLSPETIFKKMKPTNDTYQVWLSTYRALFWCYDVDLVWFSRNQFFHWCASMSINYAMIASIMHW